MPTTVCPGDAVADSSATAASMSAVLRATTTMLAPDSSNRSAIARPIPLLPPVTTAHSRSGLGRVARRRFAVAHGIGWGPVPPTSAR